jgi:phage terminase Nu1 subunit (DNA packaging protein)
VAALYRGSASARRSPLNKEEKLEMATDIEIADHLAMSDRTVRELRQRSVFPAAGQGSLADCRIAYILHLRERAAGRASDSAEEGGLDLVAERARLAKEQADGQAMKNAVLRGELVPVQPLSDAVMGLIEMSKARLLRVPAEVAKGDGPLHRRVAAAIEGALEDLTMANVQERAGGEWEEEFSGQ